MLFIYCLPLYVHTSHIMEASLASSNYDYDYYHYVRVYVCVPICSITLRNVRFESMRKIKSLCVLYVWWNLSGDF